MSHHRAIEELEAAKGETSRLVEAAQGAALAPLRAEMSAIRKAAEESQAAYAEDLAKVCLLGQYYSSH